MAKETNTQLSNQVATKMFLASRHARSGLTSQGSSPFLVLTRLSNSLADDSSSLSDYALAITGYDNDSEFSGAVSSTGTTLIGSRATNTTRILDSIGSEIFVSDQKITDCVNTAIENGISNLNSDPANTVQDIMKGAYTKELLSKCTDFVRSGSAQPVSDVTNLINEYKGKISDTDLESILSSVRSCSVQGKINYYGWIGVIKSIFTNIDAAATDGDFIMDTSSPFVLQSAISVVLGALQVTWLSIIGAVAAMASSKLYFLAPLLATVQQWFNQYIGNTVSVNLESSTYYVQGPVLAYTFGPIDLTNQYWDQQVEMTDEYWWLDPGYAIHYGPFDVYAWATPSDSDSISSPGRKTVYISINAFLSVGFNVEKAWADLHNFFDVANEPDDNGVTRKALILKGVNNVRQSWHDDGSHPSTNWYTYRDFLLETFYADINYRLTDDEVLELLSAPQRLQAYFVSCLIFNEACGFAASCRMISTKITDDTWIGKLFTMPFITGAVNNDTSIAPMGHYVNAGSILKNQVNPGNNQYWYHWQPYLYEAAAWGESEPALSVDQITTNNAPAVVLEWLQNYYTYRVIPYLSLPDQGNIYVESSYGTILKYSYKTNGSWPDAVYSFGYPNCVIPWNLGLFSAAMTSTGSSQVSKGSGVFVSHVSFFDYYHQYDDGKTVVSSIPIDRCVTIPSVTLTNVLLAMSVMAVSAAVVMIAKTVISKAIRKRAAKKRLNDTAQLSQLRDAYLNNPTQENFDALYKSTKRYNFKAKLFGWQTYDMNNNWMNDPSGSTDLTDSSPLSQLFSSKVYHAITGE